MSTFTVELEKFVSWVFTEIKTLELQIESDSSIIQNGSEDVKSVHQACKRILTCREHINYFEQLLKYYNASHQHNDYGYFAANMQEYLHKGLQGGIFGYDEIEKEFAQKISKKWISVVASAFNQ